MTREPWGACGVRGCRNPHPARPWVDRRGRSPFMATQKVERPDSWREDVMAVAIAITFLIVIAAMASVR